MSNGGFPPIMYLIKDKDIKDINKERSYEKKVVDIKNIISNVKGSKMIDNTVDKQINIIDNL